MPAFAQIVPGDRFDKVDLFIDAINQLRNDDKNRILLANKAIYYVKQYHNVPDFIENTRRIIKEEIAK